MLTVVKKSIDIKAPVDTVFTYFARPEHVSDQMSEKGVGMTVIPMDIKAGMGVGTTFRVIGDFSGKRLEWDCETTEFVRGEKISAKQIKGKFKKWEITTELLKMSVNLSEILKGSELIQWAQMINNLVKLSPVLASSYIRNSEKFLSITKGRHIDSMSLMAENIYDGSWKSGNFASKVFDHSPKFLKVLTFAEFEKIIYFLNEITAQSYDMAVECLDYSYNFLTKFHSKHTGIEFLINLKNKSSRDLKNILETSPKFLIKFDENQRITLMELILSIIDAGGYSSSTIMDDVATPFTLIHRSSYDDILELCQELANVQPQVIIGFLTKVPEILNKIDTSQMKEWFDEGLKLLNLNRDAGVAYFKLESLTSETSLSRISSSVEFDSVKDLLQLYCSALAGVELEILPSSELVDKNIGWSSTLNPTTEGKSIYVPEIINRYDNKITNYK